MLGGTYDVSVTNCNVANANNSDTTNTDGSGQSRFIEYNTDFGDVTNQYIAGNTTMLGQVDPGNSGEQILNEGNNAIWYSGYASSATANTITLVAPHGSVPGLTGGELIVTSGTGLAQTETVTGETTTYDAATDTDTIVATIAGNWAVTPDSTSYVTIGNFMTHSVVYQNTLQDMAGVEGMAENAQASTGVCIAGYQNVVDGNTLENLAEGVRISGWPGLDSPAFYQQIVNNQVLLSPDETGPYIYSPVGVALGGATSSDDAYTDFVGDVVRNNSIGDVATGITLAWQGVGSTTLLVVEQNSISTLNGIDVFDDPSTLIVNNTFTAPQGGSTDPNAIVYNGTDSTVALGSNTLNGY